MRDQLHPLGDAHAVASLRALGAAILERFSLAADDPRLTDSFAVAVAATRRKLARLGITSLDGEAERLTARREFVQVFAAAHDQAIQEVLCTIPERLRQQVMTLVDRVTQPDVDSDADWQWADPLAWRFGLDEPAHETGVLLASRCACVVFFQDRGLAENGFDPLTFSERLLQLRDAARNDADLTRSVRSITPARWN